MTCLAFVCLMMLDGQTLCRELTSSHSKRPKKRLIRDRGRPVQVSEKVFYKIWFYCHRFPPLESDEPEKELTEVLLELATATFIHVSEFTCVFLNLNCCSLTIFREDCSSGWRAPLYQHRNCFTEIFTINFSTSIWCLDWELELSAKLVRGKRA